MVLKVFGAFITVAAFSALLGVPKRYIVYAGIIGAAGRIIYLACIYFSMGEVSASFVTTLVIALGSQIYARVFKAPVTIFLITGILTIVPGSGMYRIAYYLLHGNSVRFRYYAKETIQIACMIGLAIFIMDTLFRVLQEKRWKKQESVSEE